MPLPSAVTALLVKVVVLPSPQLIVPEKSVVGAPVLASLKVAESVVGVTPSTPPLTVTVPAVSGASATVVVPVSVVWLPPSSLIVTRDVVRPSSA